MANSIKLFSNQTLAPGGSTITSSIVVFTSPYSIPWHQFVVQAEAGASCSVRIQIGPDYAHWMTWTEVGSGVATATVFGTAAAIPAGVHMARQLAWGNTTATVVLDTWITSVGPTSVGPGWTPEAVAGDVSV